jgi:hypothetical protein
MLYTSGSGEVAWTHEATLYGSSMSQPSAVAHCASARTLSTWGAPLRLLCGSVSTTAKAQQGCWEIMRGRGSACMRDAGDPVMVLPPQRGFVRKARHYPQSSYGRPCGVVGDASLRRRRAGQLPSTPSVAPPVEGRARRAKHESPAASADTR